MTFIILRHTLHLSLILPLDTNDLHNQEIYPLMSEDEAETPPLLITGDTTPMLGTIRDI